jgi:hypothetical protein
MDIEFFGYLCPNQYISGDEEAEEKIQIHQFKTFGATNAFAAELLRSQENNSQQVD